MSEYNITKKVNSHNPKTIDKLVNGTGLINILADTLQKLSNVQDPIVSFDHPFIVLNDNDFDKDDEIVKAFFSQLNGVRSAAKLINNKEVLSQKYSELVNIRISQIRNDLRSTYNALQNAIDDTNSAVKIERMASKKEKRSSGFWQIEALKGIDSALNHSLTVFTNQQFNNVKNNILKGEISNYKIASRLVKNMFDEVVPQAKIKKAYTTLQTQNNEPYLMCPKGKIELGHTVPMEISKCRENCIDSRVDQNGVVTCAYQDWLKVAFEPHDKVMARLDVTRHPDNEENLLNLNEGERAKPLKSFEKTYEERFEEAKDGINKARNSSDYENSREKQLSELKGYRTETKSDAEKKKVENTPFENQLPRKASTNNIRVSEVLSNIISKSDEGFDDNYDNFRQTFLNKFAKKDEATREEALEKHRVGKHSDESIEALLEDADYGHQFSDDDLKNFASELGLDYLLEDLREED
jgi:hypothetical protein